MRVWGNGIDDRRHMWNGGCIGEVLVEMGEKKVQHRLMPPPPPFPPSLNPPTSRRFVHIIQFLLKLANG